MLNSVNHQVSVLILWSGHVFKAIILAIGFTATSNLTRKFLMRFDKKANYSNGSQRYLSQVDVCSRKNRIALS